MKDLDKMRIKLDIQKAETAKLELQFKIEQRKEDIDRMEKHIELQNNLIEDLNQKLEGVK